MCLKKYCTILCQVIDDAGNCVAGFLRVFPKPAKIIKIDRTTQIQKKATNTNSSCGKENYLPFEWEWLNDMYYIVWVRIEVRKDLICLSIQQTPITEYSSGNEY